MTLVEIANYTFVRSAVYGACLDRHRVIVYAGGGQHFVEFETERDAGRAYRRFITDLNGTTDVPPRIEA